MVYLASKQLTVVPISSFDMRIRLRGPSGASTITLGEDATVRDLRSQISERTELSSFDVKYSYPPKPLDLEQDSTLLSDLHVRLDGEQLTISAKDGPAVERPGPDVSVAMQKKATSAASKAAKQDAKQDAASVSFAGLSSNIKDAESSPAPNTKSTGSISLQRKAMNLDTPELALPDRGATMVLRVMPDDNSCLFRAFGSAVLPGDDLSMTELRSLVASAIQNEPDIYTRVVLEQKPDDYCRWIQTEEAWGGAIEMTILSKHFDVEICSIDVKSLRIDRFNEDAPTRCILVYSGIHYDTIAQSPSDPPYTKAISPPEFDRRIWDHDDDDILIKAQVLCQKLHDEHYYTDTGGMTIRCSDCGWIGYGSGQATTHFEQTGHYRMAEQH